MLSTEFPAAGLAGRRAGSAQRLSLWPPPTQPSCCPAAGKSVLSNNALGLPDSDCEVGAHKLNKEKHLLKFIMQRNAWPLLRCFQCGLSTHFQSMCLHALLE